MESRVVERYIDTFDSCPFLYLLEINIIFVTNTIILIKPFIATIV